MGWATDQRMSEPLVPVPSEDWVQNHNIDVMAYIPSMSVIVTIDRSGRIVIPKQTRKARGLRPGTRFLLVEGKGGRLWLQRLDPKELARRIEAETGDVDLEPIIAKVEAETNRLAASRYSSPRRR